MSLGRRQRTGPDLRKIIHRTANIQNKADTIALAFVSYLAPSTRCRVYPALMRGRVHTVARTRTSTDHGNQSNGEGQSERVRADWRRGAASEAAPKPARRSRGERLKRRVGSASHDLARSGPSLSPLRERDGCPVTFALGFTTSHPGEPHSICKADIRANRPSTC